MALQGRHRYIVQKLDEQFEIFNEGVTEELVKSAPVLEKIDAFFRGDGPSRLLFYYVVAGDDPYGNASHELIVSDGSNLPLAEKAVFFLKNSPWAEDKGAPLDPTTSTDGALSFGVLSSPLESLETVVSRLYKPMLEAQAERDWGRARGLERGEFFISLDSLAASLRESSKTLEGGLDLPKPDPAVEAQAASPEGAADPSLVNYYSDLLEGWVVAVEAFLADAGRWEAPDSGPKTELDHWRRRMQRLAGIMDQLKSRQCKGVLAVLTAVTRAPPDALVDRLRVLALLRTWRQVDVNITEAANEAKDNVKHLGSLERFMEPLYSGDPEAILDMLPALLGAVRLVHTTARFYNTTERMTKLLGKVTNQMITSCKLAINGKDPPDAIFEREPGKLLRVLETCLRLNERFQSEYASTKDALLSFPKGRQFDFSEMAIFGRFNVFCRRVVRLMDIFATVRQFGALAEERMEGTEPLLVAFSKALAHFRNKGHDLLDVNENATFEADFGSFNSQIESLEASMQSYVQTTFDLAATIEERMDLVQALQGVLHRPELVADLEAKLGVVVNDYAAELAAVQENYEKNKHAPPAPRNMPPVAGNLMWARHLLRRIEEPMQRFQGNPTVMSTPGTKKVVKVYNKVARTLVAFEVLWFEAWRKSVEAARAGLQATLIIRHPKTGKLFVNFDKEILQLVRETKCLKRLGVEIPEAAESILAQEDRFKTLNVELAAAITEYDRVTDKIAPVTAKALEPHIQSLELALRPGMVTLTWTSLNVGQYLEGVRVAIASLSELVEQVSGIIDNRIERSFKIIARASMVNLPNSDCLSLDEFVMMQEAAASDVTELLGARNAEAEEAVADLLELLGKNPANSDIPPASPAVLSQLRSHYNTLAYRALLGATRNSLNAIKKRVCARAGSGFLFAQRPLFEIDVQLSVPSVRLSPSLSDVQRAINRSAVAVMGCAKKVFLWGQRDVPELERRTFFEHLGCDLEIIKVSLLLTGALHGTKSSVSRYLSTFRMYDWIWKEDKDAAYQAFVARSPSTADFESELRRFLVLESEIEAIPGLHATGALALNTSNLKLQLRNESRLWKVHPLAFAQHH